MRAKKRNKGLRVEGKSLAIPFTNEATGNVYEYTIDLAADDVGDLRKDGCPDAEECWAIIEAARMDGVALPILEKFNQKGCNYVETLALVNMICSYPRAQVQEVRLEFQELLARINALHSALSKLQDEIRDVSSDVGEATGLRSEARSVERFRGFLEVGHRLIEAKDDMQTQMLVYLCEYNRAAFGRKSPQYAKLVTLISARAQHGANEKFEARSVDALRHRYKRYRAAFPEEADRLAADAAARARIGKQRRYRVPPPFLGGKVKHI
jgi:hypothetical protein